MKESKTKKTLAVIVVSLVLILATNVMAESGKTAYDPVKNRNINIDSVSCIDVKTNQTKKIFEFERFGLSVKEKPVNKRVLVGKIKTGKTKRVMEIGRFGFYYSEQPIYDYVPLKKIDTGLKESRWEIKTFGFETTQKPVYKYEIVKK